VGHTHVENAESKLNIQLCFRFLSHKPGRDGQAQESQARQKPEDVVYENDEAPIF
jgi:hypothetical protein